jgi:hypothetical protein
MVGFGNIGGLGGLGGFGASYPTRTHEPRSTVTQSTPFASGDEWRADFQDRWDRHHLTGIEHINPMLQLIPDAPGWDPSRAVEARELMTPVVRDSVLQKLGVDPNAGFVQDFLKGAGKNVNWLGGTPYDKGSTSGGSHFVTLEGGTIQRPVDYSELEAERERMTPLYDALDRNTQSYNMMMGGNQLNGVIGADYSRPNFGQIGASSGPGNPADAFGAGQASDVFQPGETYKAPSSTPRGWGFR